MRYGKAEYDKPCQRIEHDLGVCVNVTGGPDRCTPECRPAPCRKDPDHLAGDHRNPQSDHYDGHILPPRHRERDAWRVILRNMPDTRETRLAVHTLLESAERLDRAAVSARNDKDRQVKQAMDLAVNCVHHGQRISDLETQVTAMERSGQRSEEGRKVLLNVLRALEMTVEAYRSGHLNTTVEKIIEGLAALSRQANRAHERAWRK